MPALQHAVGHEVKADGALTWHDAGHAFCVAEWMKAVLFATGLQALSTQELTLLLLAAYGHDVGNAPTVARAQAYFDYLISANSDLLSDDEVTELQWWLDRRADGVEPPLAGEEARVRHLVADYVHDRHIQIGEQWLRDHIAPVLAAHGFDDLAEGMVRLCAVHRAGLSEMLAPGLDPDFLRRGEVVVHYRFLACVLRTADVLALDPERVPRVLTDQRHGSLAAALRWRAEPHLTLTIEAGGRVVAGGRPRSSVAHRATDDTLDEIEAQLRQIADIDALRPFAKAPRRSRRLRHRWQLEPVVDRDVRPEGDSFVYVDGAFRPNTKKLLDLLAGQQLYGSPLVALREVLQNAFDAVRERIAWQRLGVPGGPADETVVKSLRSAMAVSVDLAEKEGRTWLTVRDSGAGMSRDIITNYFLVAGASRPPELHALARRARDAGFHIERSGRFGIGVLSYFMLADRVELVTRRCHEAPSSEVDGWRFTTDGVGSFGELARVEDCPAGTTVSLRIRETMEAEVVKFRKAVKHFVRRTPCQTTFSESGVTTLTLKEGWALSEEDLTQLFLKWFLPDEEPATWQQGGRERLHRENRESLRAAKDDFLSRLRWRTEAGAVGDGTAVYRLSVPCFELEGGNSLAYMAIQRHGDEILPGRLGGGCILQPHFYYQESHDGLSIENPEPDPDGDSPWPHDAGPFLLEIDWATGVAPGTVRRTSIIYNDPVWSARREVFDRVGETVRRQLKEAATSPYARVGRQVAGKTFHIRGVENLAPMPGERWWGVLRDETPGIEWANLSGLASDANHPRPLQLWGRPVHRLAEIRHKAGGLTVGYRWWRSSEYPAELCVDPEGRAFAQVFDVPHQTHTPDAELGRARFPTGAEGLILARLTQRGIFNREHPLVQAEEAEVRKKWETHLDEKTPLDQQVKALLAHPDEIPSWFCALLNTDDVFSLRRLSSIDEGEYWDVLLERDAELPRLLLDIVADAHGERRVMVFDQQRLYMGRCYLISFGESSYEKREVETVMDIDGVWRLDPGDQLQPR